DHLSKRFRDHRLAGFVLELRRQHVVGAQHFLVSDEVEPSIVLECPLRFDFALERCVAYVKTETVRFVTNEVILDDHRERFLRQIDTLENHVGTWAIARSDSLSKPAGLALKLIGHDILAVDARYRLNPAHAEDTGTEAPEGENGYDHTQNCASPPRVGVASKKVKHRQRI